MLFVNLITDGSDTSKAIGEDDVRRQVQHRRNRQQARRRRPRTYFRQPRISGHGIGRLCLVDSIDLDVLHGSQEGLGGLQLFQVLPSGVTLDKCPDLHDVGGHKIWRKCERNKPRGKVNAESRPRCEAVSYRDVEPYYSRVSILPFKGCGSVWRMYASGIEVPVKRCLPDMDDLRP
jgi:hypothetical protein